MNDIKPPVDPVNIYDRYLKIESDEKQLIRNSDLINRYAASGAGLCKRKHWFAFNNYSTSATDAASTRKMKIGTLVGKDFDAAIEWYMKHTTDYNQETIIIEGEVANDQFNILGHFDLLVIKDKKGYLYDYKTCHEFTFRKATGKILSKQNDKDNYAYQLGTYAFMIEESPDYDCDEIVYMENIYINKNDSNIKCKQIDLRYKEFAKEYWSSVNNNQKFKQPPPFGLHHFTPAYNWECKGYCNFSEHCDSPYKKKEK